VFNKSIADPAADFFPFSDVSSKNFPSVPALHPAAGRDTIEYDQDRKKKGERLMLLAIDVGNSNTSVGLFE